MKYWNLFSRKWAVFFCSLSAVSLYAQKEKESKSLPILRAESNVVHIQADGKLQPGAWIVSPSVRPDVYKTTARHVVFFCGTDSLAFSVEKGAVRDFVILTGQGDSAFTRIVGVSANPLEDPSEEMLRLASDGKLSRKQAAFDIDALAYTLGEVHPDLFSVCRQTDWFGAIHRVKAALPDSMTPVELFRRVAPLVSMLGDGHTMLRIPYNEVFTADRLRLPMIVGVTTDGRLLSKGCVDGAVPFDAQILSVNGRSATEMLTAMRPYVSGERDFFVLSRLNADFMALFEMLYESDHYVVEYRSGTDGTVHRVTLEPSTFAEIENRIQRPDRETVKKDGLSEPYTFRILKDKGVAVMDFRSFDNPERMQAFADSMLTVLQNDNIKRLIIDVRQNGGGNSRVGDVLLRYLSPQPFVQMQKALVRVTPVTQRLLNSTNTAPGWYWHEVPDSGFLEPYTTGQRHFDGETMLLTSHYTFSAAASFAWAFKAFGVGKVVGEETGGMGVSFGDFVRYSLPVSKLLCTISVKRFWHYGADERNIHGALPDYAVPSDEALDKALDVLSLSKASIRKMKGKP